MLNIIYQKLAPRLKNQHENQVTARYFWERLAFCDSAKISAFHKRDDTAELFPRVSNEKVQFRLSRVAGSSKHLQ